MKHIKIAIIGAGPAGLGCAIAAKKQNLEALILEKGNVADAIIRFPVNMIFFSTADLLELADVPFTSMTVNPTRTEAVKYYQGLSRHFGLQVEGGAEVESIKKEKDHFVISYKKHDKKQSLLADNVIVATGFYDNPNKLEVPGEDLKHVSHYYTEPFPYFNRPVVVVGGKNSAVEAALDLYRHGAKVTVIHRRKEIGESVKYWILPDIRNRISEGSIQAFFEATVDRITPDKVSFRQNGTEKSIRADAVFLLSGYHPDVELLKSAGVVFDPDTLKPKVDVKSLESNVKHLYLAGSIIAGKNANRIFIENSREHGERILDAIGNSGTG